MAYYVTDDVNNMKEKKQPVEMSNYGTSIYDRGAIKSKQSETGQMIKSSGHAAALTPKGSTATEVKEVPCLLQLFVGILIENKLY